MISPAPRTRIPLIALGAALLATATGVPSPGAAQDPQPPDPMEGLSERCHPESWRTFTSRRIEDGDRITHIGMPDLRCPDGTRIQADSAVVYEAMGLSRLMGNVRYDSPERSLRSADADYYEHNRRLFAEGDVEFTDLLRGVQIFGEQLDYLATYEHRPEERVSARGGRPRALIPPRGPEGAPDLDAEPWEVEGEHLQFEGERFFWADGDARLTREGMEATAESLTFDQETAELTLEEDARLRSEDYDLWGSRVVLVAPEDELREARALGDARLVGAHYELVGDTLHVQPPDEEGRREVHSFGNAHLDHQDMNLGGDEIRIFLLGEELERLTARRLTPEEEQEPDETPDQAPEEEGAEQAEGEDDGERQTPEAPGRDAAADLARALEEAEGADLGVPQEAPGGQQAQEDRRARVTVEEFELRADSVSIHAPDQSLERLVGVGRARGETRNRDVPEWPEAPELLRQDFLEGDTVIALFAPSEPEPGVADQPDGGSPSPLGGDPDGGQEAYVLESLEAIGEARSLYRLPPGVRSPGEDPEEPGEPEPEEDPEAEQEEPGEEGEDASPWGVSYVLANRIWIGMEDGEVDRMEAVGEVDGLHLEPREPQAEDEEGHEDGST